MTYDTANLTGLLKDGKPIESLNRKELIKLVFYLVRFRNVNHVEKTDEYLRMWGGICHEYG